MRKDRAAQRGKPLDADCYKAKISHHEYGMNDNRCFCYGLCAPHSVYEVHPKCFECGAYVDNAKPLPCAFEERLCTVQCIYYNTCTRNPYRYDQRRE